MSYRLSAQEKLALLRRAAAGESISGLCKGFNISRTIFYKWFKLYNASSESDLSLALRPRYKVGKSHWRKKSSSLEKNIIRLALRNPTWSPTLLSKHLPCSQSFVWMVLKKKKLNTIYLRQKHSLLYDDRFIGHFSLDEKFALIKKYKDGESITSLARSCGVSRTTFYKWLSDYQKGLTTAKTGLLNSHRPSGDKHWRYIVGSKKLVLDVVIEHPDFSAHKIKEELVHKFGKQLLSCYTIHGILKSLSLNTIDRRLAYATAESKLSICTSSLPKQMFPINSSNSFIEYLNEYAPWASISFILFLLIFFILHRLRL